MSGVLAGLTRPLTALALAAALYAGGYVHGRLDGRQLAERGIFQEIADRNEEAADDAETCRDRWRACIDAGGLFDFADCTCER